jgi:hypothetical protein
MDREKGAMNIIKALDISKVTEWNDFIERQSEELNELNSLYQEAINFLESYVGLIYTGIVAVFLFKIVPRSEDVDEWIWVVVGDLPPAYLTTGECPNPATALDGYIGAMLEWVDAAEKGESVANLIPVNVPATKENANMLKTRLDFLDAKILFEYQEDLKND